MVDPIGQMVYNKQKNLIGWVYDIDKYGLCRVEYQDGSRRSLTSVVFSMQLAEYKSLVSQVKNC